MLLTEQKIQYIIICEVRKMATIKLKRKTIYNEIWHTSPTKAAKKFGVLYRELLSSCNTHNIPIPDSKYFKDRLHGDPLNITPLPPSENEEVELELITRHKRYNDSRFGAKANTVCILQILEDYAGGERIITNQDIMRHLKQNYGIVMNYRTVENCVMLLKDLGYEIDMEKVNGQYQYSMTERYFTFEEALITYYSVKFNKFIPTILKEEVLQKLLALTPDKKSIWSIDNPDPYLKRDKKEEFEKCHIFEVICEAFETGKQVSFSYMKYNLDKELVPYREKPYVIIPMRVYTEKGEYYVYGRIINESIGGVSFKFDLIRNAQILETPMPEKTAGELHAEFEDKLISKGKSIRIYKPGNNPNIMPAEYPEEDINVSVKMKCKNSLLSKVCKDFSEYMQYINFTDCNDGEHFMLDVPYCSFVNTVHWAASVCDDCEVLEPQNVRDAVIELIKNNLYNV